LNPKTFTEKHLRDVKIFSLEILIKSVKDMGYL